MFGFDGTACVSPEASLKRVVLSVVVGLVALALVACSQEAAQTDLDEGSASQGRAIAEQTVPDLGGYWRHNVSHFSAPEEGPGPVAHLPGQQHLYGQDRGRGLPGTDLWIGDYRNPILQPWAADVLKAHGEEELALGQSPWQLLQLCKLVGVPHILLLREAVVFLQEPDMVTLIHQRDQQMRRVYLDQNHPAEIKPSPYGHSVGWYEGDTLVIDTIGMSNVGPIDYYGTPHSDDLHVVERYRVVEGGNALEVRFTVEDPGAFTTPWSAVQHYDRSPQTGFEEIRCAENIRDIEGGEYPVPRDDTPDF